MYRVIVPMQQGGCTGKKLELQPWSILAGRQQAATHIEVSNTKLQIRLGLSQERRQTVSAFQTRHN